MSEVVLRSPKSSDPGRQLFEKAVGEGDETVVAQFHVDTALRQIYTHASESSITEDDLAGIEAEVERVFGKALKATSYDTAPDIVHYYHLKIKHALAKQIVYTQYAFLKKERFELRREIVDGLYGAVAEILEDALDKYDTVGDDPKEIASLTGIINELTVLALLNRRQVPERIAIPSDISADLYNATDLNYFVLNSRMEIFRPYLIQVKTSSASIDSVKVPAGGIVVAAQHTLNEQFRDTEFPTSRAIVAEVNAKQTDDQVEYLDWAVERFDNHMQTGMKEADKFYDALLLLGTKELRGITDAAKNIIKNLMDENPDATGLDVTLLPPDAEIE